MYKFTKYFILVFGCCSFWSVAVLAQSPSFDCFKARAPDEIVICQTPQLAELDRLVAAGYAFLKSTRGRQSADEVGIPFWRSRQACGSDPSCIRQRQVGAIIAFHAAGAPVFPPQWTIQDRSSPQPVATPGLGPYNPNFVVDGLALGSAVYPDSAVYKSYTCRSSDDFTGFTWCAVHHTNEGKFGPYASWVTILHSSANKAAFITQAIVPAFFQPGDVEREIQRLSRDFGQTAEIHNADPRPGVPHAVLAAWGAVTLTPLDEAAMDALRRGEQIRNGLIAEFIGDAHKSARIGLSVFSIGGGPGFLWGASFDDAGKGSLRISAVDASALGFTPLVPVAPGPSTPSPEIVPAPPPQQSVQTAPTPVDTSNVRCSDLTDPAQRLACYDKAAPSAAESPAQSPPPSSQPADPNSQLGGPIGSGTPLPNWGGTLEPNAQLDDCTGDTKSAHCLEQLEDCTMYLGVINMVSYGDKWGWDTMDVRDIMASLRNVPYTRYDSATRSIISEHRFLLSLEPDVLKRLIGDVLGYKAHQLEWPKLQDLYDVRDNCIGGKLDFLPGMYFVH